VKEAKGEIHMATTKKDFRGSAEDRCQKDGQTDFGWRVSQLVVGENQGGDFGWVDPKRSGPTFT